MGQPRGGLSVKLCCGACGWQTYRVYAADRGGFGVCRCGAPLARAPRINEAKRIAKAKAELEGGPFR